MPRKSPRTRNEINNHVNQHRSSSSTRSTSVGTVSASSIPRSRSASPSSVTDLNSLSSTDSDTTRSPSPYPSTPVSHSPFPSDLLRKTLRKRNTPTCPPPSTLDGKTVTVSKIPGDMFGSRKYTPLPTSNTNGYGRGDNRRRAGGGMPAWKRWAIIGTGVVVVLVLAYSAVPTRKAHEETWNGAENTYTPDLDSKPPAADMDETDYTSPPFRPDTVHVGSPDNGDEDDDVVSIQPVGDITEHVHEKPEDDDLLEFPETASSPHDPEADEAVEAEHADSDYADPADLEDDEVVSHSGLPTSFETDPDAEGTTACSTAHSGSKPLVQYALTIDAGSTGSRIHVYKFNNCGPSPALEYETFKMINPGLSAYAGNPTGAAESLDVLLKEAQRVVPESLWHCSPVEVKATAGLRLLGAEQSEEILDEVRSHLETKYPFVVAGKGAVEIMDGKDEGVYAWITANYLLNRIGEGAKSIDTLAVMDLGGASTQIVFEPKFPSTSNKLIEGEHKYQLKFGGKEFTLYQHSYLGYGLMRARRSVHNLVAFTWSWGKGEIEWDGLDEEVMVSNPCLSKGTTRRVELDPPGRKAVNVTMHGGNGGYEACNRVVELVMAKDAVCEVKPCSFNGVYQPSLLDSFQKGQFLALSYFTDRIKPLLTASSTKSSTGAQHLTVDDLTKMAQDVCAGPATWKKRWGKHPSAMAELEDRPEYCLDLTFMRALLGLGYEIAPKRELVVEKKLNGVELGWALGAGLALVQNAKLTCTA